jgi:hypothetical protein
VLKIAHHKHRQIFFFIIQVHIVIFKIAFASFRRHSHAKPTVQTPFEVKFGPPSEVMNKKNWYFTQFHVHHCACLGPE